MSNKRKKQKQLAAEKGFNKIDQFQRNALDKGGKNVRGDRSWRGKDADNQLNRWEVKKAGAEALGKDLNPQVFYRKHKSSHKKPNKEILISRDEGYKSKTKVVDGEVESKYKKLSKGKVKRMTNRFDKQLRKHNKPMNNAKAKASRNARRVDIERTSALMQKVKNSNFPKPQENKMASESTGINRPASHTADQLTGGSKHLMDMAEGGYYSTKYAIDRAAKEGNPYEVTQSPVNPNRIDVSKPTTTTKSSTSKPNFKEGYEKTGFKTEKKQIVTDTPRKVKKGTPLKQYTYTVSEADSYKPPKVDVQKEKRKATRKSKKAMKKGDWMGAFVSGEDVKTKTVSKKRAERMKKRGWTESMKY
jgi:hypothetical protein